MYIMKNSDKLRMFADECEAEDPTAARLFRRVADIVDTPIKTYKVVYEE